MSDCVLQLDKGICAVHVAFLKKSINVSPHSFPKEG